MTGPTIAEARVVAPSLAPYRHCGHCDAYFGSRYCRSVYRL
jgi:hypothetical protein